MRFKCVKLWNLFVVKCVLICCYIFFVIFDCFWVSDRGCNFIFINIKGDILCGLIDVCSGDGFYVVNNENELFYIDVENDIKKFLKDLKILIKFI